MTAVALPDIADLDRAVDDLTDALIATTDAAEASTDGSWYIESTVEELRAALAEVASRGRAVGVPASLLAGTSRAWQAGQVELIQISGQITDNLISWLAIHPEKAA
ncbi:IolC protein [Cutibacterium acnes]|uniref:IolC protein n=1 Tax=Cutibacterium acnes TaxID=1747 RepID=UPI000BFD7CE7|nr:IolC protein [Cutibacterium acnes]WOT09301.1 IolC protein [Cutibacterium acnes subsp. defendens]